MDTSDPQRRYFTVVDDLGRAVPAVEYWAGSLDHDEPVFEIVPLRRFVRLIGTGETLREQEDRVFTGEITGRSYYRLATETRT